jgi:hypothetical protein
MSEEEGEPRYRREREAMEDEVWRDLQGCRGFALALLFLLAVGIVAGIVLALATAIFAR